MWAINTTPPPSAFLSTCRDVNTTIMELLIMVYACRTSCARNIIGVIPYFPYSKQCKMRKRGSIVSKLLASMMCKAGEGEVLIHTHAHTRHCFRINEKLWYLTIFSSANQLLTHLWREKLNLETVYFGNVLVIDPLVTFQVSGSK